MLSTSTAIAAPAALGKNVNVPRPRLIGFTYGHFRPQGAPRAYLAFRLKINEPNGQILEADYQEIRNGKPNGIGGDGIARCGIGGRKNGGVETSYFPLGKPLAPGSYHIRVVAYGSGCTKHSPIRRASRVFTIRVPG